MVKALNARPDRGDRSRSDYRLTSGERNSGMAHIIGALANTHATDASVLDYARKLNDEICQPPLPDSELKTVHKSMMAYRSEDGTAMFVEHLPTQSANLRLHLKLAGTDLRYNTRLNGVESRRLDSWQAMTDAQEAMIIDDIESTCVPEPMIGPKGDVKLGKSIHWHRAKYRESALSVAARTMVDPFLLYIEALLDWDGNPRLAGLLGELFNTDSPTDLVEWAAMSVLVGAIERAYRPGSKHDEVVVLVGPQGIGKSTLWSQLLPNPSWFGDGLNMAGSDKERVEALLGKVIVESAELRGSRRAEIDSLKAFISRDTDHVRLAYAHHPEDLPRRTIIVGTTNDEACLPNDLTGNRRFVPVRVGGGANSALNIRSYLGEHRDQLWAEALHLYKAGTRAYIDGRLSVVQAREADRHRHKNNVLEEKVESWMDVNYRDFGLVLSDFFVFTEVNNPSTHLQNEVVAIIRDHGLRVKQQRVFGKKSRVWQHADPDVHKGEQSIKGEQF